ncbi:MAG TPA: hypothetical protein VE569_12290, partial [Acidimicrobiia bacterium]|nr:hypothetical protein [Acidimicrobiia bacterium]
VQSISGGEILEGAVDELAIEVSPWVVELPVDEPGRLLGPGFDAAYVGRLLQRLGMKVEEGDPLKVTIPTYRPDLTRPADLVEEVARVHGFDKFEATLPTGPAGVLTKEERRRRKVAGALVGAGLSQAINLPFVSVNELNDLGFDTDGSDLLTVKNPLREEESKLRPSLLPGLLNDLRYNRSHGITSVGLFEMGKVFFSDADPGDPRLPHEYDRLAWAVVGDVGLGGVEPSERTADGAYSLAIWRHLADALDLVTEIVQGTHRGFHPGRTAVIGIDGRTIGYVGELAPSAAWAFDIEARVAIAELDLDPILAPVPAHQMRRPSVFPHVDFDLSFVVSATTAAGDVVAVTTQAAAELVESATVFDEFRGGSLAENEKALAITYRLRAWDRTLEQKEIGSIRQRMIETAEEIGARLRGAE